MSLKLRDWILWPISDGNKQSEYKGSQQGGPIFFFFRMRTIRKYVLSVIFLSRKYCLTFRFLLWRSPVELASAWGPRMMRVLWGHWARTTVCSPRRILRIFSAPVTRITGFPKRWVLNTFPYFSLLDIWKLEPCEVGAKAANFQFGKQPQTTKQVYYYLLLMLVQLFGLHTREINSVLC